MKWLFFLFLMVNIAYFSYSTYFTNDDRTIKKIQSSVSEKQIKLLNEVDFSELKKVQETKIALSTTEINESTIIPVLPIDRSHMVSSNQCFKIGPIDKTSMDEIRLILENKYANHISFEIEVTSAITYHRIYIPPQKTRSIIDSILKKLDDNDLNDHYVMSIDGRKNAIALGVFKNRKTAEEIATKVKYLGFSTTIESITKDKNSLYNLQFEFNDNQGLEFYNKFIFENKLKSLPCKNKD